MVTVCALDRGRVRLGFDAPKEVVIMRTELLTRDGETQRQDGAAS